MIEQRRLADIKKWPWIGLSHPAGLAGLMVFSTLAVYLPFLHNAPLFDDFNVFQANTLEHFLHPAFERRWLSYFTYGLGHLWFGPDIAAVRLINMTLHLINALLLYGLLRSLTGFAAPTISTTRQWLFPLAASLIFVAHPVLVYGVAYAAQRSGEMALTGMLASWWLVLWQQQKQQLTNSEYNAALWLLFLGALFSKEHALMLPATVAVLQTVISGQLRRSAVQLWPYLLLSLIAVVLLLLNSGFLRDSVGQSNESLISSVHGEIQRRFSAMTLSDMQASWLLQTSLFFKYWLLWLLPVPDWMSIDMRTGIPLHWLDWPWCLGPVAFLLYGIAAALLCLHARRTCRLSGFALLAPWLLFMTELATARLQEPFVLYRAYIWFPVTLCTFAVLANDAKLRTRNFALMLLPLLLILLLFSWQRLYALSTGVRAWSDAIRLIENQRKAEPDILGSGRAYLNRGMRLAALGYYQAAQKDLDQSIVLWPDVYPGYAIRGGLYYGQGRFTEAYADYQTALQLQKGDIALRDMTGMMMALAARGEVARASQALQKICLNKEVHCQRWSRFFQALYRYYHGQNAEIPAMPRLPSARTADTSRSVMPPSQ